MSFRAVTVFMCEAEFDFRGVSLIGRDVALAGGATGHGAFMGALAGCQAGSCTGVWRANDVCVSMTSLTLTFLVYP